MTRYATLLILIICVFNTPLSLAQVKIHPALWLSYQDIKSWKGITQECKQTLLDHADFGMDAPTISNMAIYTSRLEPKYIVIQIGRKFMQKKTVLFKNTHETYNYSFDPSAYISDLLCNEQNKSNLIQIPIHNLQIQRFNTKYAHFLNKITKFTIFEAQLLDQIQPNTFLKIIDHYQLKKQIPDTEYAITLLKSKDDPYLNLLHLDYRCYPAKINCKTVIAIVLSEDSTGSIEDESDLMRTIFKKTPDLFHVFSDAYNIQTYFDGLSMIKKRIPYQ